jgi:ferrochelatase
VIPQISFISKFYEHPLFIKAFAGIGQKYLQKEKYDQVLFSYHGLPERQIRKSSVNSYCQLSEKCCAVVHSKNKYCYRAQCFETSRLLAAQLGLKEGDYTVAFQSRLGKTPWIQPYAEDVIRSFPEKGIKSVLAFSPAFVADCLETTIEVGEEFQEMFEEAGGERWQLVESLNDSDLWVECLKELVINHHQ